jgi:hypothetical protein
LNCPAAGNILVQAMATGSLKNLPDIRQSFNVKRFEPTDTQKWDRAYERYMEIVAKRS